MRNTLLLSALTLAFASSSALAADVTLYGKIDTGFNYSHTAYDVDDNAFDAEDITSASFNNTSRFGMQSGQHNGSRVGLKGSEELGNGLTVSFVLENGFSSDTGTIGQNGGLFGREARLTLTHESGAEVSFGRMGSMSSNSGSYGMFWEYADALGGGWGGRVGAFNAAYSDNNGNDRFDNAILVKSPTMAGVTVYGMYSLQASGAEKAQSSQNDRFASLGATFNYGSFGAMVVADRIVNNFTPYDPSDPRYCTDDSYAVNMGAFYDFEAVKIFAAYQYSRYALSSKAASIFNVGDYSDPSGTVADSGDFLLANFLGGAKAHTFTLSASAPVAGGTAYTGYTYSTQRAENGEPVTLKTHNVYAAYDYAISKRTTVYAGTAFSQYQLTNEGALAKAKIIEGQIGLVHAF